MIENLTFRRFFFSDHQIFSFLYLYFALLLRQALEPKPIASRKNHSCLDNDLSYQNLDEEYLSTTCLRDLCREKQIWL